MATILYFIFLIGIFLIVLEIVLIYNVLIAAFLGCAFDFNARDEKVMGSIAATTNSFLAEPVLYALSEKRYEWVQCLGYMWH